MYCNFNKIAALGAALILSVGQAVRADSDVTLPRIFSDNMVLQQGTTVPIWGWGQDGTSVTVKFRDQTVSALVVHGKWSVLLHNLKPGGPDTLSVIAGNRREFKNVLVGEVWLAGGQSNMEFPLRRSFEAAADLAASANPSIRLIRVPQARRDAPTNDIGSDWSECNPETAADISAVAYYCVRDLQADLRMPVGLIESDWGGTPAEAWMDYDFLRAHPSYQIEIIKQWALEEERYGQSLEEYEKEKQAASESNTEFKKDAPRHPWKPGELYNGMIAPLVPYAIRGVLWYQGENNAGSIARGEQYHRLFPDLIRDWRSVWGEGNFPFLLVQLAPFQNGHDSWAFLREAQLQAAENLPNVAMAVITDVGDERNIHPTRKKPVGDRLALAARALAYHEPIEYSGPIYKRMEIHGNEIILTFDHVDGGLEARGEDLAGFAIAGADEKFVRARAEIKGNTVAVRSPEVERPAAVRYGWADYPVVNLWNKAGLPASPFRTDNFAK
jgi:sialate O-acetylesterase